MTDDEREGIAWWNGRTEAERLFWCRAAITAVPAEAWAYYKRCEIAGEAHGASLGSGGGSAPGRLPEVARKPGRNVAG